MMRGLRKDVGMLAGIAVFLGVRLAWFILEASGQGLLGDEAFYYPNAAVIASAVSDLFHARFALAGDAAATLVGRGWFLPGMSLLLAPIRAVTESVAAARLFVGLLNCALFLLTIHRLDRLFGRVTARTTLWALAVFPYHIAFTFRFWGDLVAAHGLLYLLTGFVGIQRDIEAEGRTRARRLAYAGAILLALIYLRPNAVVLAPMSVACLALFHLSATGGRRALARGLASGALIAGIALGGLAPWSYAVSKRFGAFFLTTTSVDINIIYGFGASTWQATLPPDKNPWTYIGDAIEDGSRATGRSFGSISRQWRNMVIRRQTIRSYATAVRRNLSLFFLDENDFLERFASPEYQSKTEKRREFGVLIRFTLALNRLLWRAALPVFLVCLLWPWQLAGAGWWLGLLHRAAFVSVALQPFISDSAGRYYVGLTPLVAASFGLMAASIRAEAAPVRPRYHERFLRWIEWGMPAVIAAALGFVLVASA